MDTIFVDFVRYGHLLAVAVGLGAAAMADMAAFTGLRRRVSPEFLTILHASHKMIWPALGLMWATGAALIGIRTGFALAEFSPKLIAKLFCVTALTLNALAIGRFGMPLMAREGGLASFTHADLRLAGVMGGVSSASWLLGLAMGSSAFLAAAPAGLFLVLLPFAYGMAIYCSCKLLRHLHRGAQVEQITGIKVRQYRIGMSPRKTPRTA